MKQHVQTLATTFGAAKHQASDHFRGVGKMIEIGKGGQHKILEWSNQQ